MVLIVLHLVFALRSEGRGASADPLPCNNEPEMFGLVLQLCVYKIGGNYWHSAIVISTIQPPSACVRLAFFQLYTWNQSFSHKVGGLNEQLEYSAHVGTPRGFAS